MCAIALVLLLGLIPVAQAQDPPWVGEVPIENQYGTMTVSSTTSMACGPLQQLGPNEFEVSCSPANPPRDCYAPAVWIAKHGNATPADIPQEQVTGTTECGSATAKCTATSGTPRCFDVEGNVQGNPPLTCNVKADPPAMTNGQWAVSCLPTEPPPSPLFLPTGP